MTETQRRISAYKKALPELRERIIAVALLLAMSVSMLTSASFAWLTLSRNPEVTAVNTTIASNGNLEIALATGNGRTAPDESKVGDSTATLGQSVTAANATWGNLVNLSDEAYGLENMVMRPAQLNRLDLLNSPLWGAAYSSDGRITELESDFGYTKWTVDENVGGRFVVSDELGVRAISSMKADSSAAENVVAGMFKDVKNANLKATSAYLALANNSGYMQSLATMMGLYMTARMNPDNASLSNPDCSIEDIQNLRDMYAGFLEAFDLETHAMAQLANLTLYLIHGEGNYVPVTTDKLLNTATTSSTLSKEGIQISNLTQFQKDRTTIESDLAKLTTLCADTTASTVKWIDSGLNAIVNNLVNVGQCTIGDNNTPISSIGASNAMSYLSGTQEARITNGILYRFEERTGGYLEVKGLGISATVERYGFTVPATVKANIKTTAPRDYTLFNNDVINSQGKVEGGSLAVDMVAQDTYGLAVDLWVRTNAEDSYLTLEGNVVTKSETVRATGKNADNETVELYTLKRTMTDEEGNSSSFSIDVYKGQVKTVDPNTNVETTAEGYLSLDSHTAVEVDEAAGDVISEKWEEVVTVIGYEGENRVWNSDAYNTMLSTDATTQGSGSCYVYYADTPEDQARSLKLLEAFNVAFIDGNGKMLASAIMDTQHYYAAVGRVTVPLVMNPSDSITLPQDAAGNVEYAITQLNRNEATRITAIVYLDGTKLSNQDVLAASDIQGQLNIQFGTTTEMIPMENEDLIYQTVNVSATVSPTSFSWDEADGPLTANVKVTVSGYEPKTVTGFFMRQLSASQGSREPTMTFTKQEDGTWTAEHTFTSPGNYVLRTVRLDGVDYDVGQEVTILDENGFPVLDENGNEQTRVDYPGSTVTGFTVTSLNCVQADDNRQINVMSALSEASVDLNLSFASNDPEKMPKTVQARFLGDDGATVNVDFTYDRMTGWSGRGTFRISGNYTLQHLVLDGEYMGLEEKFWLSANISLGMRVSVYTEDNPRFLYLPGSLLEDGVTPWDQVYSFLDMQVRIFDGSGDEKRGLSNVSLNYASGSRAMYAPLTWNGSYYVGKMDNGGPGIWKFSNVSVGDSNTITQATQSPTFTIISPNPPEYVSHGTVAYQFAPGKNQNVTMSVQLAYASTAENVVATIVNQATGQAYSVGATSSGAAGVDSENTNFFFLVPSDSNGYQDGNWKLTELTLWGGVYSSSGTEYTESAPCYFDLSDTNNVTKVVNQVTPVFAPGLSKSFGGTSLENATATFMTSHTLAKDSMSVKIEDFEHKPIQGISNVQLEFKFRTGSSSSYGGYTASGLTNATEGATITLNLAQVDGTTTYSQDADATFLYAGIYDATLRYSVAGIKDPVTYSAANGNAPGNMPTIEVWSKVPSVAITAISPTGTLTVDKTDDCKGAGCNEDATALNGHTESGATASYTATTANVYFSCSISSDRYHNYTRPSVTITLSNIGNGTNAVLSFGSGTYVYNDTTQTGTYEWTANGALKRNIGNYSSKTAATDTKTHAGTITANTLVVTYNGTDYNVALNPAITINNPY